MPSVTTHVLEAPPPPVVARAGPRSEHALLPAGELTEAQALTIIEQGREATVFALLTLSKERAELARQLAEKDKPDAAPEKNDAAEATPSTPSGMVPVYQKARTSRRRKKPGRKKGHPGARRAAPDKINRWKTHQLERCPDCGGKLPAKPARTRKRVIEDIPDTEPVATEHTIHGSWCADCEKIVEPVVEEALSGATIGHRLLALTAWLHYGLGNTLSQIIAVVNFHLLFKLSAGGLVQMWYRLQNILYGWYEEIGSAAKQSAVLFADETGWRVAGATHWLWCFTTGTETYYLIDRSRGWPALMKFFTEEFAGTLITDFWGAYERVKAAAKQKCYPHLFRELEKVDQKNSSPAWMAFRKKLKRLLRDALRLSRREAVSPEEYASRRARLDNRLDGIIEGEWKDADARRLVKRLLKYREQLFTFLDDEDVPPDNNHAEREIRPAVIIRKNSLCNRSKNGADMQAVMMSVYRTLKLRGHDPIRTMVVALREYVRTGKFPPLPAPSASLG